MVGSSRTYSVSPALGPLQLGRELDPLRLAAGELGRRLAEPEVAQADLPQDVQRAEHLRLVGEELAGRVDRQPEHVGDVLLAVLDLQRLRVVAGAVADRAWGVDARQEEQLDHDEALALAVLAAALGDVEREPPGVVAAGPRRLGRGEELADVVEQARVGGEVRARRPADRLLVDPHQPLDALHPADDPAAERGRGRPLQLRRRPRPPPASSMAEVRRRPARPGPG